MNCWSLGPKVWGKQRSHMDGFGSTKITPRRAVESHYKTQIAVKVSQEDFQDLIQGIKRDLNISVPQKNESTLISKRNSVFQYLLCRVIVIL